MRYMGYVMVFLGLLASFSAAPNRSRRQSNLSLLEQCHRVFGVPCDGLRDTSTLPSLNNDPTSAPSDCNCVLRSRCPTDDIVIDDGAGIINPRVSIIDSTPFRNELAGMTSVKRIMKCRGNDYVCCEKSRSKSGCGWRNTERILSRILDSENDQTTFGEFPWMVTVVEKQVQTSRTTNRYVGGGSLIHPRAVLTAAHKVSGKNPAFLVARAGEWDTQRQSEQISHQERDVEAVICHENFNSRNLHNDFAILILETAFDLAPNVNVICLPHPSDIFDTTRCIATGWGKDNYGRNGRYQSIIKKVEMPIVPHAPCQTVLRMTRLGRHFVLNPSFICAGGEPGLDTCTGDGGSPLVCPLQGFPGRYVQAGIVAWGIGCGADRTPGAYGNVAKARSWIDNKLARYDIDHSIYDV